MEYFSRPRHDGCACFSGNMRAQMASNKIASRIMLSFILLCAKLERTIDRAVSVQEIEQFGPFVLASNSKLQQKVSHEGPISTCGCKSHAMLNQSKIHIYIYICSPSLQHANMHILPIYPEQFLGNDCENRKIQKSKSSKIQEPQNPKIKKKQDSVDVKSFGFLDFFLIFGFLDFWVFWMFGFLELSFLL